MKKFCLIIISTIFLSGCNRQDVHQPMTNTLVKFDTAKVISQTFVSTRENLNTISACIRNPARVLVPFRFELWQQDPYIRIREIEFSGGNIDNSDCTKFKFDPVETSQNQAYEFKIISTAEIEDKLARMSVHVEAYDDEDYLGGSASLDDQPLNADLHFKTHFYQPLKIVVRESWLQLLSRLTKDFAFLLPYSLLLIGICLLCLKKPRVHK